MIHPSTPGAGDREGGEPLAKTLGGASRLKERPILFSAPMVRAILDGRKTQTRRIVKPQPPSYSEHFRQWHGRPDTWLDQDGSDYSVRCPYGQPGDRLWVRETWGALFTDRPGTPGGRKPQPGDDVRYFADPGAAWQWRDGSLPWRPSIHMPRWASRLTLEVTGVRVERLQDITEEDARAEGVGPLRSDGRLENGGSPIDAYADLWESINGPAAWDANPWVWVVEFKANSARSAPEASSPKGPLPATPEVTP